MTEFWEPVTDFPGYVISDLGKIANEKTGRILKLVDSGSHSIIVNLQSNRRSIVRQVRWLVAETFLEPPPIFDSIPQHKNRIYQDCSADNLEWMSKSDVHWRVYQERMGLSPDTRRIRILDTNETFENIFECSKHLDGHAKQIDRSMRNSEYTYKGLQFEYLD